MKEQRGVALVTVMLVVSLVTVICTGLIVRQQLAIRASGNQLTGQQARQYALGGEALGMAVLVRDFKAPGSDPQNPVDHPLEAWAKPLPAFPIEQGELIVRIEDLAGRFNLNSLLQAGKPNQLALERFRRLLVRLELQPYYAERLLDWLDEDQQPTGEYGAEDNQYLLAQPPYRTAGHALQDASELRLLLGMTEDEYRRLRPYIAALPADVPLNVNTASSVLLSSLADALDETAANALVAGRGKEGYRDVRSFLDQPAMGGTGVREAGLAVSSRYFRVHTDVRLDERRETLSSTLLRDREGKVWVVRRSIGLPGYERALPPPEDEQEEE